MIGVSYKGHRRQVDLNMDGSPAAAASFEKQFGLGIGSIARPVTKGIPAELLREINQAAGSSDLPGSQFQDNFSQDDASSVTKDHMGRPSLKGDESKPTDEKTRFYADLAGRRGWLLFDQIDPPGIGATLGDDDERKASDAGPWSLEVATPPATEDVYIEGKCVARIIYSYSRTINFSPMGRALGASRRRRQNLGMFLMSSSGSVDYGIRAYFKEAVGTGLLEHTQVLTHIAFGSTTLLPTLPDEFSTDPDEDWSFLRYPVDKNGNPLYTITPDGQIEYKVRIVPVMAAATFYGFEGKNTLVEDDYEE